jgi:hypothetical protein
LPPPQPATTPRRASSSIQGQKALEAGTSAKTGAPQAGGTNPGSFVASANTAICSRVTVSAGQ